MIHDTAPLRHRTPPCAPRCPNGPSCRAGERGEHLPPPRPPPPRPQTCPLLLSASRAHDTQQPQWPAGRSSAHGGRRLFPPTAKRDATLPVGLPLPTAHCGKRARRRREPPWDRSGACFWAAKWAGIKQRDTRHVIGEHAQLLLPPTSTDRLPIPRRFHNGSLPHAARALRLCCGLQ